MDPSPERPGVYNYNKGEFIQAQKRRISPPTTPPASQPVYDPADFSLIPLPPSSPSSPTTTTGSTSPRPMSRSQPRRMYSPKDFSVDIKTSPPKTSKPRYTPADFDLGVTAQAASQSKPSKKLKLDTNLVPLASDRKPVYSPSDFSLEVPKRPRYSPEDFRLSDESTNRPSADGSDKSDEKAVQLDREEVGGVVPVSAGAGSDAVGGPDSSQSFKGAGGRSLDSRVPSPVARKVG